MNKYVAALFMSLFFIGLSCAEIELPWPEAKITVKVIGEDNIAISNAMVHVGFRQGGNAWVGERKGQVFHGISDTNGCYTASARSEMSMGGSVEKSGYYRSFFEYSFTGNYQVIKSWQPWNPTLYIVLRKIVNPIPMYKKHIPIESEIPVADSPVGYDLMIGDWVTPYGKGQVADFVFKVKRRVASWKDFETHLSLVFTNIMDGIQPVGEVSSRGSVFRLPRTAPENSYQPEWTNSIGNIGGKGYFQTQAEDCPGYFFRVRSVIDKNGKLVHALYGKIKGTVRFDARDSKTAHIAFTYYLNPTPNDRNMEFDPKRNLFKNLKSTEEVREP